MTSNTAIKRKPIPKPINFLFGGLSGMGATLVVQPLDLLKNRLQLTGEGGGQKLYKSTFDALIKVSRSEGIFGMWNGLSAGLLRQATYTTTRMGLYTSLFEYFSTEGKPPNLVLKGAIAMFSGAVGAFVGTPADLTLIRMTADGRLPKEQQRGYKNAFDGLYRVGKEEGLTKMWSGWRPTVTRAIVVNAAQLASYSQAKQSLIESKYFKDNLLCHFTASMTSGLITTVASMPVDICKTRIQNQKPDVGGKLPYKNALDVFVKVIRHEGLFSLWKGSLPYYARIGPHTVLFFILIEQMKILYYRFKD